MAAALAAGLADTGSVGVGPTPTPGPGNGAERLTVTLACVGDDGSMARLLGAESAAAVVDLAAPRDWTDVDAAVASTIERFGGDGDVAEEWRRLPGADLVATLVALGEAVAATDVLVVDLGDLRRAGALLAAATRTTRVLRGLLGLQAAGARLVGPAAAHAGPRWLDALEAAGEVLHAPETKLHVVAGPASVAATKIRRNVPGLLLSGVGPGLLVAHDHSRLGLGTPHDWAPFRRVAPRGWPVDDSGRLRPDAGDLVTPLLTELQEVTDMPSAVSRATDHLTWRLPLPWVRAEDVLIEHRGDDLVVDVYGTAHLLVPPAVVRRCTPVRARLDGTYLEIESVIREGVWRRRG